MNKLELYLSDMNQSQIFNVQPVVIKRWCVLELAGKLMGSPEMLLVQVGQDWTFVILLSSPNDTDTQQSLRSNVLEHNYKRHAHCLA